MTVGRYGNLKILRLQGYNEIWVGWEGRGEERVGVLHLEPRAASDVSQHHIKAGTVRDLLLGCENDDGTTALMTANAFN